MICDRVYFSKKEPDDHIKLSLPNFCDSKELANFKSRVRSRHETVKGRVTFFLILSDTYHHRHENHKIAFEAVCILVINQKDHGTLLFG